MTAPRSWDEVVADDDGHIVWTRWRIVRAEPRACMTDAMMGIVLRHYTPEDQHGVHFTLHYPDGERVYGRAAAHVGDVGACIGDLLRVTDGERTVTYRLRTCRWVDHYDNTADHDLWLLEWPD